MIQYVSVVKMTFEKKKTLTSFQDQPVMWRALLTYCMWAELGYNTALPLATLGTLERKNYP